MGKIYITTNDSLRQLQYDAVTNTIKMTSSYDTIYRCPRDCKIRIDSLPGTIYHTKFLVTEDMFKEIKDLGIEPENMNKGETFAYGLMVAKTLRGTGSRKGPLFNVLANLHLSDNININDMIVHVTEGEEYALCYPHTTNREIPTNFMTTVETDLDRAIKSIIKYEANTSADAVIDELEYFAIYNKGGSAIVNAYFDGEFMIADRSWDVKK